MLKKGKSLFLLALIAFLAALYASPYYAIHQMREAAKQQDAHSLNRYVDYPALRQSLKSSINLKMQQTQNSQDGLNPLSGLAMGFASKFVDVMVDTFVTPKALAAIMEGEQPAQQRAATTTQQSEKASDKKISYHYQGVNDFRLSFADENAKPVMHLNFQRDGLFNWKLNAINFE